VPEQRIISPTPNMSDRLSSLEENDFHQQNILSTTPWNAYRTEHKGVHTGHYGTRPLKCPRSPDKNKPPSIFPQSLMFLTEIREFYGCNICRRFDFQQSLHANSGQHLEIRHDRTFRDPIH
jgi:hypothetical protein